MGIDEDKMGALFADYINRGYRLRDLSEFLNVSSSTLTNRLKKLFNNSLLKTHYNVFFQKLPFKVRFIAVSLNQRQSIDKCIKNELDLITGYYTPLPTLTYFIYVVQRDDEEIEFNTSKCKVLLDENIHASLMPIENFIERRVDLRKPDETFHPVDEIDLQIVKEIFQYFNPPPIGNINYIKLCRTIENEVEFKRKKNHFYKHVLNKLAVKRILYREPSRYSITLIYSSSLKEAVFLLNELFNKGFLNGIDQVNVISLNPNILVMHGWVNEELLWQPNYLHEQNGYFKYEVHLVKRMEDKWS